MPAATCIRWRREPTRTRPRSLPEASVRQRSRLLRPPPRDLLRFVAGHPHHKDFRSGGAGLVPDRVGWAYVPCHPGAEQVALAVHDVLELAGEHVEDLDRAMRVIARVGVRRERELPDGYLGTHIRVIEGEAQGGAAWRTIGLAGLARLRSGGGCGTDKEDCTGSEDASDHALEYRS